MQYSYHAEELMRRAGKLIVDAHARRLKLVRKGFAFILEGVYFGSYDRRGGGSPRRSA
jgi:hypothetical protein